MPFDISPSAHQAPGGDWKTSLDRGDVVWFRFPVIDAERSARVPKRRPCLVLDVFTRGERRFAQIAYGTSAGTTANRGYEIVVKQPAGCAAAGLDRPTRFVGSRRLIVSLDHAGFDTDRATGSPIIGRLDAPLIARMNAVRARMQAEADIAAEAREEARKERARWRRETRGLPKRNRGSRGATAHPQ